MNVRALICALAFVAGTQAMADPITVQVGPSPIRAVLGEISKATGETYAVAEELQADIVIVQVTNREASEVLDRLANVTEGKWVTRNGVRTLEVDTARQRERREAENKETVDTFIGALEQFTKVESEMTAALAKLLLAQPRAVLVRMATERTVLSSSPNRLQTPLAGRYAELAQLMIDSTNAQAEAMNQMPLEEIQPMLKLFKAMGLDTTTFLPQPVTTEPAELVVVSETSDNRFTDETMIKVFLADTEGRVISSTILPISDWRGMMEAEPEAPVEDTDAGVAVEETPPGIPALDWVPEVPLKRGPESTRFERIMQRQYQMEAMMAPFADEDRALLIRPDLHEPLELFAGDIMRQTAEHGDLDIVGLLPDRMLLGSFGLENEDVSLRNFWMAWTPYLTVEHDAGWVSLSPEDLDESREVRVNRPALAALLLASETGRPSLDQWADYMRAGGLRDELGFGNVESLYLGFVLGQQQGMDAITMDRNALRVWAHLSDNQRDSIRGGNGVRLGTLNRATVDALYRWLLKASLLPVRQESQGGMRLMSAFFAGMSVGMGPQIGFLWQEPTELLGNGWNQDALIGAYVTEEPVLTPVTLDGKPISAFPVMGPEEYAFFTEMLNGPAAGQVTMPTRFEISDRTVIELAARLTPTHELRGTLTDVRERAGRPVRGRDELPKDFTDKVEAARKAMDALGIMEFFRMMGEGGMRGQPPTESP